MSATINPAGWVASATSTANAAATATRAAPTAPLKHVIFGVDVTFNAAVTTASTLTLKDGSTVIWTAQIPTGAVQFSRTFMRGIAITSGNAASAVIAAAGASVTSTVNIDGVTF